MKVYLTVVILHLFYFAAAQTGPGGVGDATTNVLWLSADQGVYSNTAGTTPAVNGNNVAVWNDRSGNGRNATHSVTGEQPDFRTNVRNGLPVIRFSAANNDRLLSTGLVTANRASVFVVASWSSLPSSNPGIIQGAPSGSAFSSATNQKTIGMWVSSAGGNQVWGRGVESDNNTVDIPQTTNTTAGTFYSFLNLYNGSTITQYVDNATAGSIGYDGTLNDWSDFGIGRQASESWNGDIAEVIAFNVAVNDAQRIIINSYLAAKYDLTVSGDMYTMDIGGNGNYDYDVAGIGRVNSTNIHDDARGSGIVRVLNPTSLGNGDFLMWGHDNGAMSLTTSNIPSSVTARFARVWGVSEAGEVGNVDIEFDLTGISCESAPSLRLLVDTDNDNSFADQTPISGATYVSGNTYRFSGVSALENGVRFALAIDSSPVNDGPGGVGSTNGLSSLVLWLNASKVSGTNGSTITSWTDQSGYSNDFTVGAGAVFNTSGRNGNPTFSFNGTSHYFERPFSSSLTPGTFTIVSANNVTSSTDYRAVISNRDDPAGDETRGFILYANPGNDWTFWNGHATIAWQQLDATTSTTGNWAAITASYRTGTSGKNIYVNNSLENTATAALHPNTSMPIRVGAGQNESGPNFFFRGQMGEVIVYNTVLNAAQRIIVNNYLSAKYDFTLSDDDTYTRDNAGQGNFDHDVAGIGRVDGSNLHSDSRGTGIVRVFNPTSLGNGDFFFWGHNNEPLSDINTTDLPAGIQGRLSRVWRISESGNIGNVDIQVDMTGMGPITTSDLRVRLDQTGTVSSGASQYTATALGCNNYLFSGVPGNTDGYYFTIGTRDVSQTPLPIQILSFAGESIDRAVWLKWVTLTETNNRSFSIERSRDGMHFISIGEVSGAGTTRQKKTYSYEDRFAPYSVLYYRLKQTDFDGAYSYSDVIRVDNTNTGTELVVSPNPLADGDPLTLRIRHKEMIDMSIVKVRVFDVLGREVPVSILEADGDKMLVTFANDRAGVYIMTASSPQLDSPLVTRVLIN